MTQPAYTLLNDRGILAIEGEDAREFLQGLVSNDVTSVEPHTAIHAALLTAQGKYLHDFFIAEVGGRLLLDCEAARSADLLRRLSLYKLRAKVALSDVSTDYAVAVLYGNGAAQALGLAADPGRAAERDGGTVFVDPRLADIGARAILPKPTAEQILQDAGFSATPFADYDARRIRLGLPDGSRDLVVEKSILLENGFDELGGVSWNKGCYMGQELTARTKYRGLIKKRLLPVVIEGAAPEPGTPIMAGDREAGEMRSHQGNMGLALVRLEYLDAETPLLLNAGDTVIRPEKPAWAAFAPAGPPAPGQS